MKNQAFRTSTSSRRFGQALLLGVLLSALGCVRGPTLQEVERSRRSVDLAVALHDEGNRPAAIAQLREALEMDPGNPEAHVLMAVLQYERGDYDLAAEHGRRGVDAFVDRQVRGARLAEARNILGSVLLAAGRSDEAIEVLTAAAHDEMNAAPHLAYGNLGLALLQVERNDEAIEALRTSVRLQRRFCVGYLRLGMALVAEERWGDAEEALSLAVSADDACAEAIQLQAAWRLRAEAHANLGRREDAISDLERCVTLSAESPDGELCEQLLEVAGAAPQ